MSVKPAYKAKNLTYYQASIVELKISESKGHHLQQNSASNNLGILDNHPVIWWHLILDVLKIERN